MTEDNLKPENATDANVLLADSKKFAYDEAHSIALRVLELLRPHCEVSYGTQTTLKKFLRRECNLDYFCDVDTSELQNITIEEVGNFND